jgi:hypothetical protein
MFATPTLYAPSMTGQLSAGFSSAPASYAAPVAHMPMMQPVSAESDSIGWSHIAMLAVVGTIAGAALSSAKKGTSKQVTAPDVESGTVAHLAGPIAALAVKGETVADLQTLAKQLNPAVGFYDPLNLSEGEFWDQSNEATIGFLRHAEIKHGRVAMAGFVGFLVHANGIHFPWKIPGDELCAPGVSPVLLWDNMPIEAKAQIILTLGLFEFYSEAAVARNPSLGGHYMRGGKPGFFPPLKAGKGEGKNGVVTDAEGYQLLPHPVPLNLYDPFNLNSKKSEEWKAQKLQVEINNGRLAMIGLMGFLAEGAIPGSVPLLNGLIPASGEVNVMDPFNFSTPLGTS